MIWCESPRDRHRNSRSSSQECDELQRFAPAFVFQ
jgi:hypothetical protein